MAVMVLDTCWCRPIEYVIVTFLCPTWTLATVLLNVRDDRVVLANLHDRAPIRDASRGTRHAAGRRRRHVRC